MIVVGKYATVEDAAIVLRMFARTRGWRPSVTDLKTGGHSTLIVYLYTGKIRGASSFADLERVAYSGPESAVLQNLPRANTSKSFTAEHQSNGKKEKERPNSGINPDVNALYREAAAQRLREIAIDLKHAPNTIELREHDPTLLAYIYNRQFPNISSLTDLEKLAYRGRAEPEFQRRPRAPRTVKKIEAREAETFSPTSKIKRPEMPVPEEPRAEIETPKPPEPKVKSLAEAMVETEVDGLSRLRELRRDILRKRREREKPRIVEAKPNPPETLKQAKAPAQPPPAPLDTSLLEPLSDKEFRAATRAYYGLFDVAFEDGNYVVQLMSILRTKERSQEGVSTDLKTGDYAARRLLNHGYEWGLLSYRRDRDEGNGWLDYIYFLDPAKVRGFLERVDKAKSILAEHLKRGEGGAESVRENEDWTILRYMLENDFEMPPGLIEKIDNKGDKSAEDWLSFLKNEGLAKEQPRPQAAPLTKVKSPAPTPA